MQRSVWTPIAVATLVCGTLDILLAVVLTLMRGREPADMRRLVASGAFPSATGMGAAKMFAAVAAAITGSGSAAVTSTRPWSSPKRMAAGLGTFGSVT
jgi:hypothetical protein